MLQSELRGVPAHGDVVHLCLSYAVHASLGWAWRRPGSKGTPLEAAERLRVLLTKDHPGLWIRCFEDLYIQYVQ